MAKQSMSDLVANVSTGKNRGEKAKEYAAYSEWPKCTAPDCPLPTTIKDDRCTCGYHHRENGFMADCITEAIKENLAYIKKYNSMLYWNVRQWKEKAPQIMGWPVLPATQSDINLPTVYLAKFKKFIDDSINERASEIYQGH